MRAARRVHGLSVKDQPCLQRPFSSLLLPSSRRRAKLTTASARSAVTLVAAPCMPEQTRPGRSAPNCSARPASGSSAPGATLQPADCEQTNACRGVGSKGCGVLLGPHGCRDSAQETAQQSSPRQSLCSTLTTPVRFGAAVPATAQTPQSPTKSRAQSAPAPAQALHDKHLAGSLHAGDAVQCASLAAGAGSVEGRPLGSAVIGGSAATAADAGSSAQGHGGVKRATADKVSGPRAKKPRIQITLGAIPDDMCLLTDAQPLSASRQQPRSPTQAQSACTSSLDASLLGAQQCGSPQAAAAPAASKAPLRRTAAKGSRASAPSQRRARAAVPAACARPPAAVLETQAVPRSVKADRDMINTMNVSRRTSSRCVSPIWSGQACRPCLLGSLRSKRVALCKRSMRKGSEWPLTRAHGACRWSEFARDGAPWNADEEEWLHHHFAIGCSLAWLSQQLSRTQSAVKARIKQRRSGAGLPATTASARRPPMPAETAESPAPPSSSVQQSSGQQETSTCNRGTAERACGAQDALQRVLACPVPGCARPSNSATLDRAALRSLSTGAHDDCDAAAGAASAAEAVELAAGDAEAAVRVDMDALHAAVVSATADCPPMARAGGSVALASPVRRCAAGVGGGQEQWAGMFDTCKMAEARCAGQSNGGAARAASSDARSAGVSVDVPRRLSASCLLL